MCFRNEHWTEMCAALSGQPGHMVTVRTHCSPPGVCLPQESGGVADARYPQGPAYTGTPTEGPAPQASPMCCSSPVNVPPLSHTEPPLHRVRGTQPGPPGPGPRSAHPHVQRTLEGTHSTYSCTPGHVPAQATRQRPGTPGEGDGCRALASPSRSILSADRGGDGPAPARCRPWGTGWDHAVGKAG